MQFIKKFVRGLASLFFVILIFNLAVVSALVMTFNSPHKIEKSLTDSGVYKTFVSGALQEAQKSGDKDKSNDSIPISDPAIVQAANKAFTPELLQSTTETVLNGTYDWLAGKVKTPNFTINFVTAKQTFATAVGEAAIARLKGLPVCTVAQLKQLDPNVDAFSTPCRPPGINLDNKQAEVTNQIATSKDFLGTPQLTPQNLPKDSNGKTVFDQISKAPTVYKWVNASPWLLAGLVLITGLIVFFLHESKRRGLRSLAITTAVIGALLVLTNIGTTSAFNKLSQPNGKLGEAVKGSFQQTIIKGMDSISHSIESIILWFGIAYLILGVGTLVILYFTKPKKPAAKPESKDPTPPIDDSPKQENPKPKPTEPKPATKPATRSIPIQG